jgi:hypothetical protein
MLGLLGKVHELVLKLLFFFFIFSKEVYFAQFWRL